ncbi:NarK/NasA family nitrate transporter [Pseudomonas sp. Leaf58]|nr:nitrate/nitrite transporter [Pseudomonas sp. Leaf58]AYG47421.1 NarK/NasA family nitrate transporter [Pseudomonas sp. Leaf58]KQN58552.1 MFS transporter [Pseudomonas sp. Leaf58]
MMQRNVQQGLVLGMSTTAFTICFMVWMMFAVLGVPIKDLLDLNETQFGLLAATPVLSGSLVRLPLGMLGDRFGGRIVFFVLMLVCVLPIYLVGSAHEYWQFLLLGLFVGLAGGSFSVGIAYVAKWFEASRQGLAMGIFGAGNAGSALTKFLAPAIIAAASWQMVPKVFSAILFVTAVMFWCFTYEDKSHRVASSVSLRDQLATLKDPRVWRYCQYYSIVFGGYVALALWMTQYYVGEYGFSLQSAALLAACFSLPGGVLRAVGGWLADRWGAQSVTWWVMWVSWVCLFLLSYPQTDITLQTVDGPRSFHIGLNVWVFTALMFVVGVAWAFGKASVFKYIADEFPDRMGAVSGIVGLAGGLGGFVLPILFGALVDLTGVRSSNFMLLYGVVWVSLIWMYLSEVRKAPVLGAKHSDS